MYTQRVTYYPAVGKGPELRALLEERVKHVQSAGAEVALGVRMFGGPAGNPYIVNLRFQDLAAVEAYRRRNQADPAFAAYNAKVATTLSCAAEIELYETVIPNPATPALTAPYFTQRALFYPGQGKGPEVRALLEERVKGLQASGEHANLSMGVYGSENPMFAFARFFQNMAAVEATRVRNQSDAMFLAFQTKMNPLVRQPTKVEFGEVLIPIG